MSRYVVKGPYSKNDHQRVPNRTKLRLLVSYDFRIRDMTENISEYPVNFFVTINRILFKFGTDVPQGATSSGYKVGHPGHSKYVWVGQYEPSCLKFPSSVLEDKL